VRICKSWTSAVGVAWGAVAVLAAMDACGPGWTAGPCLRYSDCATGYTCADGMCEPLPVPVPDGGGEDGSQEEVDTGPDVTKADAGASAKDASHDAADAKGATGG